jgi:hypothetical protein
MKKKWAIVLSIVIVVLLGLIAVGPAMSRVEQPKYQVLSSVENIEVRQYPPLIVAQVQVQGEREAAIKEGFRLLADYIFGNNTVQQSIAMTAPVQQQANEKIAMTAPVQQQAFNNAWKVSFVMPSKYSMDTLPKPNNPKVSIQQLPEKRWVALRFSGFTSNKNIAEHEQRLLEYMAKNHLQALGVPQYAFYNPPWTLPFLRHHEVMVEIDNHTL